MAGKNDSIITLGLDLTEETEQNLGYIIGEAGKAGGELAADAENPGPSAGEKEQAAQLEEARAAAEEARQREEAEKQRQQEQERSR